jgi:hypothetical protein
MMTEPVKFISITRTICPKTGIHYLDAISEDGLHYTAELSSNIEKWLVYTKHWSANRQQPYK